MKKTITYIIESIIELKQIMKNPEMQKLRLKILFLVFYGS